MWACAPAAATEYPGRTLRNSLEKDWRSERAGDAEPGSPPGRSRLMAHGAPIILTIDCCEWYTDPLAPINAGEYAIAQILPEPRRVERSQQFFSCGLG